MDIGGDSEDIEIGFGSGDEAILIACLIASSVSGALCMLCRAAEASWRVEETLKGEEQDTTTLSADAAMLA